MKKETINIQPTVKTPAVLLDPDGTIKISGRAIDESRTDFSDQIITWLDNYLLNPARITTVIIALEYLNSFNSIILTALLRRLLQIQQNSKVLVIKWYVEEGDDDLLERSQYISSTLDFPIEYVVTENIKDFY